MKYASNGYWLLRKTTRWKIIFNGSERPPCSLGVPLDLFQRTVISTCSISAIGFTNATPIVLSVNNTESLKDLAPS